MTAYNYHPGYLPVQMLDTTHLRPVGDALEEGQSAKDIEEMFNHLFFFSQDNTGKLMSWLKALYKRCGTQFSVIIFDTTD